MDNIKAKRRGVYLKNSKQKEELEEYDPIEGKGLKLQWLNFISVYIKNGGNATDAYIAAYPEVNKESARRNGSRLLTHADILEEIQNRYDEQKVTDAWVIAIAMRYVMAGVVENTKVALAGVKALEIIAKSKGMLSDIQKIGFTSENPAVFLPLMSKEEAAILDEMIKSGQRIIE